MSNSSNHILSDQTLEIKDRASERKSNFMNLGKTRGKFSQSEVMKITLKGRLLRK